MSAADTTCYSVPPERDNGAGEMKCYKTYAGSSLTNIIASEIVNDILENALDVVMQKNKKKPSKKIEKISTNVVGDILENILSKSTNSDKSNINYVQDETVLLDDEIKKIIKEMKYPPEQKTPISTKGVGDQLSNKPEITIPDKVLAQPGKRNTLERKNRLTNLVRNSKQMLSKFMTNDDEKGLCSNSEEKEEKFIKVIDFESIRMDDNITFKIQTNVTSESGELKFSHDSVMDVVDLQTDEKDDSACGENVSKEKENPGSLCEKKAEKATNKGEHSHKRKWNFGTRILRYLRRHPKKEQKESHLENQ